MQRGGLSQENQRELYRRCWVYYKRYTRREQRNLSCMRCMRCLCGEKGWGEVGWRFVHRFVQNAGRAPASDVSVERKLEAGQRLLSFFSIMVPTPYTSPRTLAVVVTGRQSMLSLALRPTRVRRVLAALAATCTGFLRPDAAGRLPAAAHQSADAITRGGRGRP